MLRPVSDLCYEEIRDLLSKQLATREDLPRELRDLVVITQDKTTSRAQFAEDSLVLWQWLIQNAQCEIVPEEVVVYAIYCLKFSYLFKREEACRVLYK